MRHDLYEIDRKRKLSLFSFRKSQNLEINKIRYLDNEARYETVEEAAERDN